MLFPLNLKVFKVNLLSMLSAERETRLIFGVSAWLKWASSAYPVDFTGFCFFLLTFVDFFEDFVSALVIWSCCQEGSNRCEENIDRIELRGITATGQKQGRLKSSF